MRARDIKKFGVVSQHGDRLQRLAQALRRRKGRREGVKEGGRGGGVCEMGANKNGDGHRKLARAR